MTSAIFSDLDGTLIYSARHLGDVRDLTPVESLGGREQAWMTDNAASTLASVRQHALFIPVTTRVEEQYRRVRLPGGPAEYAIVGNGGRIYIDGIEDTDWTQRMRDTGEDVGAPQMMADVLERVLEGETWTKAVRAFDNIVCVTAHRGHRIPPLCQSMLARFAEDFGFTAHVQGRKTHIIPRHVTKEGAAAEIARKVGATRTFAAGDHGLDEGMMRWATDAIQPAHGIGAAGIRQTTRTGILAGEDIVTEFHRFAVLPVRA